MALQPIPLGPDVLFTIGNGPYADSNIFDNLTGAGIIPMGGGVSIVVYRIANPVTPFQVDTTARAFTVNGDGTQNWGNALQLGSGGNQGGVGVALDATRALVVYDAAPTQMTFRVLTLNGLTLSAGATTLYTIGGTFDSFGVSERPFKVMSPTTVLFGFRATRGTSTEAIRVQLLQVTGTTVTVDNSNALSIVDGPFSSFGGLELCQVDKYTCAFFWFDGSNASFFGQVQLQPTFDSMTDVGFGASQLYDGVTYQLNDFRELSFGFVLAVGFHTPGQLVAEILEFGSFAHALIKGPVVELLETAPNPITTLGQIMAIAGHQAVLLTRRSPPSDQLQHGRFIVLNLGTDAREVKEIGAVDFEMVTGGQPVHAPEIPVALNPRRVMMAYTPGGGGGITIERMLTVGIPLVDPLRWRQRDDCLTPGTGTVCICLGLPVGVICVPPFSLWLTSSVQFGGGVGPRNHYY